MTSKTASKTTTVGLVVRDYVVLAADKRATAGTMVAHNRVMKIQKIDDHAAMTISGLVADAQYIVEQARYISRKYSLDMGKPISIRGLASQISIILQAYLRMNPFIVQLIIGGYDAAPHIYYVDLFGSLSEEKYIATGSGSPVAYGVLESGYREDLSLEEAKDLAYRAVRAATERDSYSGEGVDIVVIGKDLYEEETRLFRKKVVSL